MSAHSNWEQAARQEKVYGNLPPMERYAWKPSIMWPGLFTTGCFPGPNPCTVSPKKNIGSPKQFLSYTSSLKQSRRHWGTPYWSLLDALLEFVRHHVFPHENSFVYHTRHEVYHMEVHTNTAHEGTNNGIKHCSAPIRPQNSLDKAARALSLGASLHQSSTSMDVCRMMRRTLLTSQSPTSEFLTDLGEKLVCQEWLAKHNWVPYKKREI